MSNMNLNNPWRSSRLIGYRDAVMAAVTVLVCGFLGGGWMLFQ